VPGRHRIAEIAAAETSRRGLDDGARGMYGSGGSRDGESVEMCWLVILVVTLGVASCAEYKAANGPLTEFPGIQAQIQNYYDDNATEEDWVCDEVQMENITASKVVAQSPTQMKLAVTYYFTSFDESPRRGGDECQGFNTRFFTFDRNADGSLRLQSMSGSQQQD
jgi:hypothetical protein